MVRPVFCYIVVLVVRHLELVRVNHIKRCLMEDNASPQLDGNQTVSTVVTQHHPAHAGNYCTQ